MTNRRRVAALLRALADEIDEMPAAPRAVRKVEPPVEIDDLARARAERALREAGAIGSGSATPRRRRRHAPTPTTRDR